ncbi:hypothetical protein QBC46DRAFT_268874 [Diplogelasinospora grovesii]|uniref:Zn(2)-C6 fungal-type domain-containing protein n=1 Tax=Diplogelasinospora grovesii TaxID=303347 RepID=A0AAN6S0N2_9PEZI|nr:hypothetical protein QBC46DRAFT_268874 [Diplogelasinospora grovesii]
MDVATDSHTGGGSSAGPELLTPEQKKRNRIRLSCTTCREKKLKCNRQSPCDQCGKRGITATCEFIPYENLSLGTSPLRPARDPPQPEPGSGSNGQRPKASTSDATLQARLRHLEHLVQVLKSQRRDNPEPAPVSPVGESQNAEHRITHGCNFNESAGHIVGDLRYVDAANWEAILDDIADLTNDHKTADEASDDHDPVMQATFDKKGPVLLLGGFPHATVTEMIVHLPPRPVADRLIARFFQTKEPAWMMFHVPTFLRQYDEFWEDSSQASYTWVGLLFIMFAHAALYCIRGDEEVPGNLGTPLQVFDAYRIRAAHCLALGDYTTPGVYKIEAMMLYFGCEYLGKHDAVMGTSILLTVIVRLAMHMGLHRDPRHYPAMSPFEGEMRRRIWTLLTEIDSMVAFQFGLPGNIHSRFWDTEPPRNIHDDEFDETTKELPPSRPETERTVTLYACVKARLMKAFGDIITAITSSQPVSYAEIMRLDKQLEEAHDSFPPTIRYRPFNQSLVDPIDLIMQRYLLDLLYQKSRSVLHRKYMGIARIDKRYAHSRWTCLDAATKTLRHQYDIHCEIQPGGRLCKDRWFLSSLSIHDFLLADMILCLELSIINAKEKSPEASAHAVEVLASDMSQPVMSKEQLLEILGTSRSIWETARHESFEANRGFKILSRMLAMSTGATSESSPESSDSSAFKKFDMLHPPPFHLAADSGSSLSSVIPSMAGTALTSHVTSGNSSPWPPPVGMGTTAWQFPATWTPDLTSVNMADFPSMESMDGLTDPSLTGDWSLWDHQIQNANAEIPQIPWDTFFQPNAPGV